MRGEALAEAALGQRLKTVELRADRGAILDAKGEPLAVTIEAYDITADPSLISDPMGAAMAIAPIANVDPAELARKLAESDKRFAYVARGVSPEVWDRVQALELAGILGVQTPRRVYPGGSTAANIVGFVNAEGEAAGGLELGFDTMLAGSSGEKTVERVLGKQVPTAPATITEAVPGSSVQLTIDRDIQHVAQQAIADAVQRSASDWGTVVVMDPATGDILALAEAPTFDANDPGSANDADRGTRSLTTPFEPGSTGKVISIAGVVNEGAANPYTYFKVPGSLKRGDKAFGDHFEHNGLNLTLTGIMAKSSNIGTILAAERIGKRKLYRYEKLFGIGEPLNLGIPGESMGSIPPVGRWSPTTFPTLAFGQGYSANSVQMASVYATIANDGVRVPPRLVSAVIAPDGQRTEAPAGRSTIAISPQAAEQVRAMLEATTQEGGTGTSARIPGYRVGGKTGTAQLVENGRYGRGVVASFAGIAPIDDPQLVVSVSLVNPRAGRYGGELGGPVFKDVMTFALQQRQIPPTGTKAPSLPLGG